MGSILLSFSTYLLGQAKTVKFTHTDSVFVFNPHFSLKIKQKMIDSAFANNSTAPNFVVIVATDLASRVSKEICTEAPFVEGGIDKNEGKEKYQNVERLHFSFNTKAALNNIGFNEYSYEELLKYGQNMAVRNIVAKVLKSNKDIEMNFQGTRKEQFMLAHILFNNGIMSTRGDIAGNLMVLSKIK
jgi:hypothetical protein